MSFGISETVEQAQERVVLALTHDPWFKKKWAGGVFYPVALHAGVTNPRK